MSDTTLLTLSDAKISKITPKEEGNISERLYATFSIPANASLETVWNVLLDKIENPERYNPEAGDCKILERHDNEVLREMKALNMTV